MPTLAAQQKQVKIVRRGCGTRRAGMTYMVTNPDWFRKFPLSYFLFDPPILVENPGAWGLSPQGISYVNKNGVIHAQDWIGSDYPCPADVLEEAANPESGASGLVPLTSQIGQLTPGKSRRLLFHPAGWLYNVKEYKEQLVTGNLMPDCAHSEDDPAYKIHRAVNDQMCSMMHWQHLPKNGNGTNVPILGRTVTRTIGDTSYTGAMELTDTPAQVGLALIAWLPIDELHVVQGDEDRVNKALELLGQISDIPFFVTNA